MSGIQFYRAEDADGEVFHQEPMAPATIEGLNRFMNEGGSQGAEVKQLCSIPGFSIAVGWFKSNLPAPLHQHDADCLYHVVGGSMRMGGRDLEKGDGVFVPANTPYTFTAGPEGVEVLEFRHVAQCSAKVLASSAAYWDKIVNVAASSRDRWAAEKRPTERA
ncbi:cupin domain-containing protein [Rhizorhabdus sp.]|uniref:cupin domain-containing protein n=1 Tax=Rhizorhabdus sp. TaxID=1968843 RepID=UPI0019AC4CC5|nr:cupin domain-containing protein [Rhizorhabdus sp.]MBD3759626.1 cupin domain-containing protein [Rhizorhabdus sp.]